MSVAATQAFGRSASSENEVDPIQIDEDMHIFLYYLLV